MLRTAEPGTTTAACTVACLARIAARFRFPGPASALGSCGGGGGAIGARGGEACGADDITTSIAPDSLDGDDNGHPRMAAFAAAAAAIAAVAACCCGDAGVPFACQRWPGGALTLAGGWREAAEEAGKGPVPSGYAVSISVSRCTARASHWAVRSSSREVRAEFASRSIRTSCRNAPAFRARSPLPRSPLSPD